MTTPPPPSSTPNSAPTPAHNGDKAKEANARLASDAWANAPVHILNARCARLMDVLSATHRAIQKGRPADNYLAHYFSRHRECGSKDRRFLSDMVFSFYRWYGWVRPEGSAPIDYARALLQAQSLDTDAWHPTLRPLMEQVPESSAITPCGSANLTEKAHALAQWTGRSPDPQPIDLIPNWAAAELYIPSDSAPTHLHALLEALQKRPPTWLRLPRGHEANALDRLHRDGYDVTPHPQLSSAASCERAISRETLDGARVEVQDLASQLVGHLCAVQPGEQWWDACAGAGGKTLALAEALQGEGRILATDIRPEPLRELERRANRARIAKQISIAKADTLQFHPREPLDGVLVDAPCSGTGTWSRNPDARWRMTHQQAQQLQTLQRNCLQHASSFVRPGGRLVYSACTLTRPETIDIAEEFGKTHPEFEIEPSPPPLTGAEGDAYTWVWPWQGPCDGMFIARWRRRE